MVYFLGKKDGPIHEVVYRTSFSGKLECISEYLLLCLLFLSSFSFLSSSPFSFLLFLFFCPFSFPLSYPPPLSPPSHLLFHLPLISSFTSLSSPLSPPSHLLFSRPQGWHRPLFSPNFMYFIDYASTVTRPEWVCSSLFYSSYLVISFSLPFFSRLTPPSSFSFFLYFPFQVGLFRSNGELISILEKNEVPTSPPPPPPFPYLPFRIGTSSRRVQLMLPRVLRILDE